MQQLHVLDAMFENLDILDISANHDNSKYPMVVTYHFVLGLTCPDEVNCWLERHAAHHSLHLRYRSPYRPTTLEHR